MTDDVKTVSGNQKRRMRSAARFYAVQALFQMEHSQQSVSSVVQEFLSHRFGAELDEGVDMADGDIDLFRKLIEDARPRLEARLVPAKPPAMVPPASAPLPAQAVQPLPQPNPGTPKR